MVIKILSLLLLLSSLGFGEFFIIEPDSFGRTEIEPANKLVTDDGYYWVLEGTRVQERNQYGKLINKGDLKIPENFDLGKTHALVSSSFLYPVPAPARELTRSEYIELLELGRFFRFYKGNIKSSEALDYVSTLKKRGLPLLSNILEQKPELVQKFQDLYLVCESLF